MRLKKMARNNWNLFVNNSEKRLMLIGLISFLLAAMLSNWNNMMLLGSLKITNTNIKPWFASIFNLAVVVSINISLLYLFAILRYTKTRFVDVLNSVLMAHISMYVLLTVSVIPVVADFLKSIEFLVLDHVDDPSLIPMDKVIWMIIFAIFAMFCLIIFFVLLIMGMKIAMNSKKGSDTIIIVLLTLFLNIVLQFVDLYL